ncbi:MAG: alpha/beta hydrolase [Opitutaceae bacterium]
MRWLLFAFAGWVLVAISARLMAGSMIYFPQYASRRAPAELKRIPDGKGGEIEVLHLANPTARFTVWFFHGNAEDLGDLEPLLRKLRDAGFAVFASEYPGYGHSSGRPSEATLYSSARIARRYLREELGVPASRTLLYGRSLGGGPAVQMAGEEKTAGLVLQSTFVSAYRVVTRWRLLPFDQFENLRKIARIDCPLLVMHGRADEVIPFRHGEKLFAASREPKRSFWVPAAHHNDFLAVAGADYWNELREFSELCARAGGTKP